MVDKNSIRFGTNKGIRFAAVVDNKIRYNDQTQEIGFLVTRRTLLEANGETSEDLKVYIDPELGEPYLDEDKDGIRGIGVTEKNTRFVYGKVYDRDSELDIVYDRTGGILLGDERIQNGDAYGIMTALTGIPESNYKDMLVGPYIKMEDGYFYGDWRENSYYNVALSIKNSPEIYDNLTEEEQAEIDAIVGIVG